MVTCLLFFVLFSNRVTNASFIHPHQHYAAPPARVLSGEGPHQRGQDAQIISSSPFFLNQMSNAPPSSSSPFQKKTTITRKQSSKSDVDLSFIRQQESNDPSVTGSTSTSISGMSSALRKTFQAAGTPSLLKPFILSKKEVALNLVQLLTLLIISRIFMIPTGQRWLLESKLFSAFPQNQLPGYGMMSFEGWISHSATQIYGLTVLLKLLSSTSTTKVKEESDAHFSQKAIQKRRSFGMIFGIQQIMGVFLILSHMFMGNAPMHVCEQRLFDVAMYLMKVSTFLIGFIVQSPVFGWVALLPISILSLQKHVLDFGTLFGIILSTFGFASLLAIPNNILPLLFKMSYVAIPVLSFAATQVLQSVFGIAVSSNIRHVLVDSMLALVFIFMRWTLIKEEEAKVQ